MQTHFKAACWDWAHSSVVEVMFSKHKALAWSSALQNKQANKNLYIVSMQTRFYYFSVLAVWTRVQV